MVNCFQHILSLVMVVAVLAFVFKLSCCDTGKYVSVKQSDSKEVCEEQMKDATLPALTLTLKCF